MSPFGTLTLRQQVKRLGRLAFVLIGLTVVMLGAAVLIASGVGPTHVIGELPVGSRDEVPAVPLIVAAVAGIASVFVLLAALHTAAAMRVLSRDRRIPRPMSPEARGLRNLVLMSLAPRSLVKDPVPPESMLVAIAKPAKTRMVPRARGVRRDQHDHLRDPRDRQAAPAASRLNHWRECACA